MRALDLSFATVTAITDVVDDGLSLEIHTMYVDGTSDIHVFAKDEGPLQLLVVERDEAGTALGLGYDVGGELATAQGLATVLDRSDRKAYRMGRHALRNATTKLEAGRRASMRRMRHLTANAQSSYEARLRRMAAVLEDATIANDDAIILEMAA